MRLSANISMLFTELPFLDRFQAARSAGFGAVEFWWPDDAAPSAIRDAALASGVDVALFNFYAGDMASGERGVLSDRRVNRNSVSMCRKHSRSQRR